MRVIWSENKEGMVDGLVEISCGVAPSRRTMSNGLPFEIRNAPCSRKHYGFHACMHAFNHECMAILLKMCPLENGARGAAMPRPLLVVARKHRFCYKSFFVCAFFLLRRNSHCPLYLPPTVSHSPTCLLRRCNYRSTRRSRPSNSPLLHFASSLTRARRRSSLRRRWATPTGRTWWPQR